MSNMGIVERLMFFYLCVMALHGVVGRAPFPFTTQRRSAKSDPTQNSETTKRMPHYLMKLFHRRVKTLAGNVNTIRAVFPTKTTRGKRAMRLLFNHATLQHEELWQRDELRLFMNKPKGSLSLSRRPYYLLKIFDIFSRKLISVHKIPITKNGWQTVPITGWRDAGVNRVYKQRVGLKLVVLLGKKKIRIDHTPLRQSKPRREPYLVVYLQDKRIFQKKSSGEKRRKTIYHDSEKLPVEHFNGKRVERD